VRIGFTNLATFSSGVSQTYLIPFFFLACLALLCLLAHFQTLHEVRRAETNSMDELSGFFIDFRLRDGRTSIDYIPPMWGLPFSFVDFRLRDGRTSISVGLSVFFRRFSVT